MAAPQTLMEKMHQPRRLAPLPGEEPEIRGILKIVQLDERNLCVSGCYQDFLNARLLTECGPFLKRMESDEFRPQDWSRRFHYHFAALEVIAAYRPQIIHAWKQGFEIRTKEGAEVPIRRFGWWLNPVSAGHFPCFGPESEMINDAAQVTHHLFIEFEKPLKDGTVYTFRNTLGEEVSFKYSPQNHTEAIQLNQVGTAADAGRKYAYLGIWRGPELAGRDYSEMEGKPFYIRNLKGETVFEGKIARRETSDEAREHFTGNSVWELDFSEFCTPGKYRIFVPGVGCSWRFTLGNDALGEAFYVRMRGMYQKRCGSAKEEPFTRWTGGACHRTTYQGKFPPNWRHYGLGKGDEGFYTKDGTRVELKQFDVIRVTGIADEEHVVPDVYGGWHDAADYDRRPMHLQCVGDFVTAYLFFPENFSDGQLNLPESGNGIPDILDEAIWGTDVWRRAQNTEGGVGCWIEASSHPGNYVPETDEQPYFLALPSVEGSAEYASYAASLALALRTAGEETLAQKFTDSALRAYRFAQNPKNRLIVEYPAFPLRVNGKETPTDLTYRESEAVPAASLGKAAMDFYFLTGDAAYLKELHRYRELGFDREILEMSWRTSPFWCAELLTEVPKLFKDGKLPSAAADLSSEKAVSFGTDELKDLLEIYALYSQEMQKLADVRLDELNNNYAYRMPWYAPNHAYVSHMSWGNFHPLNRAKVFITAWKLTGDTKYRDAAFLCSDWQLGANPTGSSMTSGLGKNYPAYFLDLPSYGDGIAEFVPGISPYRYVFGLNRGAVSTAYGLYVPEREDHGFSALQIPFVDEKIAGNTEKSENTASSGSFGTVSGTASAAIPDINTYAKRVGECIPILHRFGNVEGWSVAASEYTVSETISTAAAISGCLLQPGWKPSKKLKERKPVSDLKELPGFWALP